MFLFLLYITSLLPVLFVLLMNKQSPLIKKWLFLFYSIQCIIVISGMIDFYNTKPIIYNELIYNFIPSFNFKIHVGIFGVSFLMIFLTSIISLTGVLMSWAVSKDIQIFFLLITVLNLSAIGFFTNLNLFILFFFLELAVIPKFLLIHFWGTGKKRSFYSMKLLISLTFGSILILIGIVLLLKESKSISFEYLDIMYLKNISLDIMKEKIIFLFLFLGFGVFAAIFPFHFWVPGAHASAPTAGSMFLASVSLKLGSFGCILVACILFPRAAFEYKELILIIGLVSILYGGLLTIVQYDLKFLNAFSSISHCGFIVLGLGLLTKTSLLGALSQLFSHGLIAGLMFAIIGMIYNRTHTKMLPRMSGLLTNIPFIASAFIIAGLCSIGLPGSSSFIAEFLIFLGSWELPVNNQHRIVAVLSSIGIIFSVIYILKAFKNTVFGKIKNWGHVLFDAQWNEKLVIFILFSCIFLVGFYPTMLINFLSIDFNNFLFKISTL